MITECVLRVGKLVEREFDDYVGHVLVFDCVRGSVSIAIAD